MTVHKRPKKDRHYVTIAMAATILGISEVEVRRIASSWNSRINSHAVRFVSLRVLPRWIDNFLPVPVRKPARKRLHNAPKVHVDIVRKNIGKSSALYRLPRPKHLVIMHGPAYRWSKSARNHEHDVLEATHDYETLQLRADERRLIADTVRGPSPNAPENVDEAKR